MLSPYIKELLFYIADCLGFLSVRLSVCVHVSRIIYLSVCMFLSFLNCELLCSYRHFVLVRLYKSIRFLTNLIKKSKIRFFNFIDKLKLYTICCFWQLPASFCLSKVNSFTLFLYSVSLSIIWWTWSVTNPRIVNIKTNVIRSSSFSTQSENSTNVSWFIYI